MAKNFSDLEEAGGRAAEDAGDEQSKSARRGSYQAAAASDGPPQTPQATQAAQGSTGAPSTMFCDAEAMKERLRQSMMKPKYDVCNFYKQVGFCQMVARSQKFEYTTLSVIALNALWISIDTDLNGADMFLEAHPTFQIAEHFFCIYFTFEWVMRLGAFEKKRNGLRDAWFVFDSFMVFMMVSETWIMTIVLLATGNGGSSSLGNASILRLLRLLRLSRMARMAKLLRSMPELLILIKGMVAAMRSVFFTLLLLLIIIYVFAIAFRQLLDGTNVGKNYFNSIFKSMHTLLIDGTLLDGTGSVVRALDAESAGFIYVLLFYLFILLAALTVMNMLIGVLCEVVSAVASTERESITLGMLKDGFLEIMDSGGLDEDGDHMISRKEFEAILDIPDATRLLKRVEVDVYALVDLADYIFAQEDDTEEETKLSVSDFLEVVLSLRGCNQAMVKDMVDLRKFIRGSFQQLEHKMKERGMLHGCEMPHGGQLPPQSRSSSKSVAGPSRAGSKMVPAQAIASSAGRGADGMEGPADGLEPRACPRPVSRPQSPDAGAVQALQPSPKALPQASARALWLQAVKMEGMLTSAQLEVQKFLAELPGAPSGPSSGSSTADASSQELQQSSSSERLNADGPDASGARRFLAMRSRSNVSVHVVDPLPSRVDSSGSLCSAGGLVLSPHTATPSTRAPSEERKASKQWEERKASKQWDERKASKQPDALPGQACTVQGLRVRLTRLGQLLATETSQLQNLLDLT